MTKPCPNANCNGTDAWRHGPAQDWSPCPLSELDALCNCCEQCERSCALEAGPIDPRYDVETARLPRQEPLGRDFETALDGAMWELFERA